MPVPSCDSRSDRRSAILRCRAPPEFQTGVGVSPTSIVPSDGVDADPDHEVGLKAVAVCLNQAEWVARVFHVEEHLVIFINQRDRGRIRLERGRGAGMRHESERH